MAKMAEKKQHWHEKRGLSFVELGAFLGTEALLKEGFVHHDLSGCPVEGEHRFNMSQVMRKIHCGTVGCFGGTMALLMGLTSPRGYIQEKRETDREGLGELFFPLNGNEGQHYVDYAAITVAETLEAVANYKRTGKPAWRAVLGRNRITVRWP